MSNLELINLRLDAEPRNQQIGLVLADAVQEQGDEFNLEAEAIRWMARNDKRPRQDDDSFSWVNEEFRFRWDELHYCIPGKLFKLMHKHNYYSVVTLHFATRREAEEALMRAYCEIFRRKTKPPVQ